jgi:hypothetical protein
MSRPPSIGETVHYLSHGSADGAYTSVCRPAVVSEAGAWVTAEVREESSGHRVLTQRFEPEACALVVLNPGGTFFKECEHDERMARPGTWHWTHL